MIHAPVLHEDDFILFCEFPGLLVADPLLEPDNVDIASFFFSCNSLLDGFQCILGATENQDDIDPLRDRLQVGVALALQDHFAGRVHGDDVVTLFGQILGNPVGRFPGSFDMP
jgi:hypothetical protein